MELWKFSRIQKKAAEEDKKNRERTEQREPREQIGLNLIKTLIIWNVSDPNTQVKVRDVRLDKKQEPTISSVHKKSILHTETQRD